MKVPAVILVTVGLCLAAEVQHKRGSEEYASTQKPAPQGSPQENAKYQQQYVFQAKAQTYSPPQQLNYVAAQTYKYIPQPALAQIRYVPQQDHAGAVPNPSQQAAQYATSNNAIYGGAQSAIKTVPAPQKLSYSQEEPQIQHHQVQQQQQQQPQHHHQQAQYSSAADVSSFKFQSPLVTYSNLGVLQQAIGKNAEQAKSQAQQQIARHPAQQTYTQVQAQPQQQFVYKPKFQIPQLTYNPHSAQVPNEKLQIYSQAPQTFQTEQKQQQQQQQHVVYQQVAPKHAASVPQQVVYAVPQQQQYTYAPVQYVQQEAHSVPQPNYVIAPQYQAIPAAYHQHAVQQ